MKRPDEHTGLVDSVELPRVLVDEEVLKLQNTYGTTAIDSLGDQSQRILCASDISTACESSLPVSMVQAMERLHDVDASLCPRVAFIRSEESSVSHSVLFCETSFTNMNLVDSTLEQCACILQCGDALKEEWIERLQRAQEWMQNAIRDHSLRELVESGNGRAIGSLYGLSVHQIFVPSIAQARDLLQRTSNASQQWLSKAATITRDKADTGHTKIVAYDGETGTVHPKIQRPEIGTALVIPESVFRHSE